MAHSSLHRSLAKYGEDILDQLDPKLERSFRGHRGSVNDVSFCPSMKQLASAGSDKVLMIWNFRPKLRAWKFIGHSNEVTSVQYAPDGKRLISGSKDCSIRIWESKVNGQSQCLRSHTGVVRDVSFNKEGNLAVSCSDDKTIKLWNIETVKFWRSLTGHSNWVRTARMSNDNCLVVSGGDDKTVRIWDVRASNCVQCFSDHIDVVTCVRFNPQSSLVASTSRDESLKIWDLRSSRLLQHYDAHSGCANCVDFHPNGNFVISGGSDGVLKVWDIIEGQQLYTIHGHESSVRSVSFSRNGEKFASTADEPLVMVWSTNFDSVDKVLASAVTKKTRNTAQNTHSSSSSSASSKKPSKSGGTSTVSKQPPMSPVRLPAALGKFSPASPKVAKQLIPKLDIPQMSSVYSMDTADYQASTMTAQSDEQGSSYTATTTDRTGLTDTLSPLYQKKGTVHSKVNMDEKSDLGAVGRGGGSYATHAFSDLSHRPATAPLSGPRSDRSKLIGKDLPRSVFGEELGATLEHVVNQLTIITQTLALFDKRLSNQEDKVTELSQQMHALQRQSQ